MEDAAVEAEGDHALLDAGAGTVVDADQRTAGLDGQLLHLDDFLAVDLSEGAAEHGGVLAEHTHVATVNGAVAGDHPVTGGAVGLQAEVLAAVLGQCVKLDEGVVVQQCQDALAGGELAFGVHLLHGGLTDRVQRLFGALAQISKLSGSGVDVDLVLGGRLSHAGHEVMVSAGVPGVAGGPY